MKSPVSHWTDARFKSFITSAIRGAFGRFPNKFEALKKAAVGKRINKKTGREAMHYCCASCKESFPAKDVAVDHKKPVVDPKKGFVDWDLYIERMFCKTSNLQVLCKPCHAIKTKQERKERTCTTQPLKKRTTSTRSQRSKN